MKSPLSPEKTSAPCVEKISTIPAKPTSTPIILLPLRISRPQNQDRSNVESGGGVGQDRDPRRSSVFQGPENQHSLDDDADSGQQQQHAPMLEKQPSNVLPIPFFQQHRHKEERGENKPYKGEIHGFDIVGMNSKQQPPQRIKTGPKHCGAQAQQNSLSHLIHWTPRQIIHFLRNSGSGRIGCVQIRKLRCRK